MRIRKTGVIFGLMAAAAVVGLCVSLSSSEGEIPPVEPLMLIPSHPIVSPA